MSDRGGNNERETPEHVTAGDGSAWVISRTFSGYGRPAPRGREYWVQFVGESPRPSLPALAGVVGFYAGSREMALRRLGIAS